MARILWIIGFSITILMFTFMTALCLIALVTRRRLNPTGWTMLVMGAYSAYFMFGRLRAVIRYGDPTKDSDSQAARICGQGNRMKGMNN